MKKSYAASDNVSKILIILPARWRPNVTTIEEARDLNTLSVQDLMSSLKVHEISLNEHDSTKKSKFIALKSKGKQSQVLKANESEEESPDGDSDEDSVVGQKMAMLSNKLQYLAKKNKKFFSRSSGYKGSKKEDKKVASTARSLDTSLLIVLIFRRRNQRRSPRNPLLSRRSIEYILSRV